MQSLPATALPRWLQLLMNSTFGEFLLYDIFVSLLIGVVIWLTDRSYAGITAFFLSAILLLIVKLYSEMVKMHQQFDASLHHEDEVIQTVRADLLRIIDVNHALLRDADFFRYGTGILRSYSALLNGRDDLFLERARTVLKDCNNELQRLQSGELYRGRDSNFSNILQTKLRSTKQKAFFTSYIGADVSWSGGAGKSYRALNVARAKDGVEITRVFIVDDVAGIDDATKELLREQIKANMNVRVAVASQLGRDALYDMGIYDDKYVSYFEITPGTKEIRAHRTFNSPEALDQAFELRERLIENSDEASSLLKL